MRNLDEVTSSVPWDHAFFFDGQRWPTVAPQMADLAMLESGLKGQIPLQQTLDRISQLIVGGCDAGRFSDDQLRAWVEDYIGFFAQWQARKAAARKTPTATGSSGPFGTSSPRS